MRLIYTFSWTVALPLALCRLWWRGRREPGYRQHVGERLGIFHNTLTDAPVIWIHAVSVGETRAAEPLIRALMQEFPSHRILLSHMTPTGRATGAALFKVELGSNKLQQCYLPYDLPLLMNRLLRCFKPDLCILMETEVWPNLIEVCRQQSVPVALVNARLSARSLRKALRFSSLFGPASAGLGLVAAQTAADAVRIRQLGAVSVHVTGNSKFDVTVPAAKVDAGHTLRQQWQGRKVLLCASTREGEEALILDAFLAAQLHNFLLLIVPRHPQRFDQVEQLARQRGLSVLRKTAITGQAVPQDIQLVVGDTMGELVEYYVSCDLAFIGGSLLPLGGQNLIEACAVGKPVLLGPHTFNFAAVSADAIASGAALCVADASELFLRSAELLDDSDQCSMMRQNALAFSDQHRGATDRTLTLLRPLIKQ